MSARGTLISEPRRSGRATIVVSLWPSRSVPRLHITCVLWRACATIKFGARRAGDKKRGRDGTKYSRFHRRNYLSRHLAAIVSAVVLTDASNIEDGITALKQRVTGLAPAGSA